MSTIKISCVDQTLRFTNTPVIASGGVHEDFVEFTFCPLWDGFAKTVMFYAPDGTVRPAVINGQNVCEVPAGALISPGMVGIAVFGFGPDSTIRTTELLTYRVVEGAVHDVPDPDPDVYDQIMAEMVDLRAAVDEVDTSYVIRYIAQTLTDAQQQQARGNIGAAAQDHTHDPEDIGAATAGHTHTPASIGAAAKDHTHTPASIGAATEGHTHSLDSLGAAAAGHTHAPADIGAAAAVHTHAVKDISDVTATAEEINSLSGVSGNVQAQIDNATDALATKVSNSEKGAAGGVATLNESGKVTATQASGEIVSIAANTTITAAHLGKFLFTTSSSDTTITLPTSSDIPVGAEVEIYHHGSGAVYVQSDASCYVSFDGKSTASRKLTVPRFGAIGMKKVTNATWKVSGEAEG